MVKEINWDQIQEWDKRYYFHVKQAADEYRFLPVSHTEGNYVYLVGGMKILDFCSQVIATNLGYKNPRVNAAIKEALDEIGYVQELFCTEYRTRAAKLIMDDLLGPDDWAGRIRFVNTVVNGAQQEDLF